MQTRRSTLWLTLGLLMLFAAALRLFQIQTQSIWFDEGWSAYAAAQPTLIGAIQADATNPPLYYLLLNLAARGFGTSEFALRVVSLLIGLPLIPLVYQLARRAADRRAGVYAALLTTFSAPLWWASQEARMYTLLALLIVIAALAWQWLITRPSRAAWIALWLAELALLYAHNTGPVAVIWLNAVTLVAWIAARRPDWRVWIAGQIGVGLLWLPYFLMRFLLLPAANSAITSAPALGLPLIAQVWGGLWIAPWALALKGLPAFVLTLALVGLVSVLVLRWRARWLIAHTLILTLGLIAGLIALGNNLHGRYLVMIVPLLLAVVGIGLASLPRRWLRYLAVTPFLLLALFDLIDAQNLDYQHDNARGMVQYYAEHLTAADTVIDWSYADRYDLAYYWDRLGVAAKRVTLPEGADLDQVLPLLPTSGDVSLNVWYTQRADYRGMLGCLLGNGTVDQPDTFTTYGMTTLTYHQPSLDLPQLQPVDFTFSDSGGHPVAQIVSVGQVTSAAADRALCLPLKLTLAETTTVDLKAALIVQNDLGWEVARADAIFATADQRTTSAARPGDLFTAYPLLRLPYGAPPGDYHLFLRLYDETTNPSGYNPPSDHTISGRDLLLATWTTLPGADWTQVNRATDLPHVIKLALSGSLTLVAHDLPLDRPTLANGDQLRAALLWRGTGALPDLELAADDGAWRVTVPTRLTDHGAVTLDWRTIQIPADAPSGSASLRINGWAVLAHYQIQARPLLTTAPSFAQSVGVEFPGVGELVGYTLDDPPFSRDTAPKLTLIWQAGDHAPAVSYTVFAQLINTQGQVIAQDDAIPANRPTTGWRAGEYLQDDHRLKFNDNATAGTTKLIVGLYDASTGQRIHLADGADAVTLAQGIEIR